MLDFLILIIQGSAANRSGGLTVAEINHLLGVSPGGDSEGSDNETGGGASAPKKVSYNIFFSSSCILTYSIYWARFDDGLAAFIEVVTDVGLDSKQTWTRCL